MKNYSCHALGYTFTRKADIVYTCIVDVPPTSPPPSSSTLSLSLSSPPDPSSPYFTFISQLSTAQASIVSQSPTEAKKHQLASQLFGGLSGPSRPPKSKQHRKTPNIATAGSFDSTAPTSSSSLKPPRQVTAAVKKPKEPQVDLLLDLEGIDFSAPAAIAPQQTTGIVERERERGGERGGGQGRERGGKGEREKQQK